MSVNTVLLVSTFTLKPPKFDIFKEIISSQCTTFRYLITAYFHRKNLEGSDFVLTKGLEKIKKNSRSYFHFKNNIIK